MQDSNSGAYSDVKQEDPFGYTPTSLSRSSEYVTSQQALRAFQAFRQCPSEISDTGQYYASQTSRPAHSSQGAYRMEPYNLNKFIENRDCAMGYSGLNNDMRSVGYPDGMTSSMSMGGMANFTSTNEMANPTSLGGMANPTSMGGMANPSAMGSMSTPTYTSLDKMDNCSSMGTMNMPANMGEMVNPTVRTSDNQRGLMGSSCAQDSYKIHSLDTGTTGDKFKTNDDRPDFRLTSQVFTVVVCKK